MGQSNVAGYTRDTVNAEAFRADCTIMESVTQHAFNKCVDKSKMADDHVLITKEASCLEEYTLLYGTFLRQANGQINHQYELMQREMMEKMRAEMQRGGGGGGR